MIETPFKIDEAEFSKAGFEITAKARAALAQLTDKIEVAGRQAFADGLDFAVGPVEPERPDPFAVRNIFTPERIAITVKAGPCPRSFDAPPGWTVYRNPDYRGPK